MKILRDKLEWGIVNANGETLKINGVKLAIDGKGHFVLYCISCRTFFKPFENHFNIVWKK